MAKITKAQIVRAADRTHDDLDEALRKTIERMDAILADLGSRDVNNCYVWDNAQEIRLFAKVLNKSVDSFLTVHDTMSGD